MKRRITTEAVNNKFTSCLTKPNCEKREIHMYVVYTYLSKEKKLVRQSVSESRDRTTEINIQSLIVN